MISQKKKYYLNIFFLIFFNSNCISCHTCNRDKNYYSYYIINIKNEIKKKNSNIFFLKIFVI